MSKTETRAELFKRQELWKANLMINGLGTKAMDYDNAVMCLKHLIPILEDTPPSDPAYQHFVKETCHFQKLAAAHATVIANNTGEVRTDHVKPLEVMWCYRTNDGTEVVEETVLYIPLASKSHNIDFDLSVAGSQRLILENLKPENLASLQVVKQ